MDCKLFGICDWLFGALINGEGDYDYEVGFRGGTEIENDQIKAVHLIGNPVCVGCGNGQTVAAEAETFAMSSNAKQGTDR